MLKVFVLLSLIAGAHFIVVPPIVRQKIVVPVDGVEGGPIRNNEFVLLGAGVRGAGVRGAGVRGAVESGFVLPIRVAEDPIKSYNVAGAGVRGGVPDPDSYPDIFSGSLVPEKEQHSEYGIPKEEPHSEYGVPKALPVIEATTAHVCPEEDIIPPFADAPAAPSFLPLPYVPVPEVRIEVPEVPTGPYPSAGVRSQPEPVPHSEYGIPEEVITTTTAISFVEVPEGPKAFPLPVPEIPVIEAPRIAVPEGPYPAKIEEPIVRDAPYPARGEPDLRGLQFQFK